ncbi:MAG: hypothetical protein LBU68_01675, partial [Rickettsiales bacterium]|nr:hypothetical protein [Rickettsiales bacterium]
LATDENANNSCIVLTTNINQNPNNAEILCTIDFPITVDDTKNFNRIICFFNNENENTPSLIESFLPKERNNFHLYTQQADGKWTS